LIEQIDRDDDPRLQSYRHVGDPQWLQNHGLFVAEGRLVVRRLIDHGQYQVVSILVTPAAHRAHAFPDTSNLPVYVADQPIVYGVTGFNFHRGCLAIVRRLAPIPLSAFASARTVVVLEGVGNPDNIGGIFRSAAAFGADGVILDPTSGDPLYRKAVRTSMGAVLRLPFTRAESWPDALETLRGMGFAVVALTTTGSSTVDELATSSRVGSRIALLAGAEGAGLTDAAQRRADMTVRIPIDSRSDSLNVVVAVSIVLHRCASNQDSFSSSPS
jgi:tRNA G18 (ribose-2'-O)-methylase SpoU